MCVNECVFVCVYVRVCVYVCVCDTVLICSYHLELVVSEYSPSGFHVDLNDYLDVEKKYSRTSALMESPLLHVMKVLFMDLPIPCKKKTDFPEEKVEMDMPFTVKMLLELW